VFVAVVQSVADRRRWPARGRCVPIFTRGLAPLAVVHLAGWPAAAREWLPAIPNERRRRGGGRKSERTEWSHYRSPATERPAVGLSGVLPVPLGRVHGEEGPTNRLAGPAHIFRDGDASPNRPKAGPLTPLSFNAVPATSRTNVSLLCGLLASQ